MHTAQIRQEVIDRILDRRGRLHLFDRFEPNETALVVIDMQPTFVADDVQAKTLASLKPGSPDTLLWRELTPGRARRDDAGLQHSYDRGRDSRPLGRRAPRDPRDVHTAVWRCANGGHADRSCAIVPLKGPGH